VKKRFTTETHHGGLAARRQGEEQDLQHRGTEDAEEGWEARAKSKANPTARRRRRVLRQDKGEFVGVFCFTVFERSGRRFV